MLITPTFSQASPVRAVRKHKGQHGNADSSPSTPIIQFIRSKPGSLHFSSSRLLPISGLLRFASQEEGRRKICVKPNAPRRPSSRHGLACEGDIWQNLTASYFWDGQKILFSSLSVPGISANWINSRSDHSMAGAEIDSEPAVLGRLINTCIAFRLDTRDVKSCMQGDRFAVQGALS